MKLRATEVFTPNDFPEHTYVEREGKKLEERLRNALETPNTVISLSGPSKSGKTVLVERVVGTDNLIPVSGAELREPDDLWERVLDWMEVPASVTEQSSEGQTQQVSAGLSGKGKVPLIAEGGAQAGYQHGITKIEAATLTTARRGLADVQKEIADSEFVGSSTTSTTWSQPFRLQWRSRLELPQRVASVSASHRCPIERMTL
jgi:hypothetical protein